MDKQVNLWGKVLFHELLSEWIDAIFVIRKTKGEQIYPYSNRNNIAI